VWAGWAYPTERICGRIQRAVKGRRFPYASIDKYVLHEAQLAVVKLWYPKIREELTLTPKPAQNTHIVGQCEWA
jgi:hypothetical protein